MLFNKVYVGEAVENTLQIQYFVIQRENFYGIGLEEATERGILCDYEYFTEEQEEALEVAKMLQQGSVTLTSMTEILDDYIQ
ncbi:DUF6514 family protein [Niameybacter massiliensis]|uniref:DUF6514 family protein n=1 Tax=Holtiella tumoricola TaxID=3018743 RepID=A0AA42DLN6_9FIRM|nr:MULTISPECIES: DUF6514 family protein [Lachnospirales]MDA3731271.1 DUF6514 family protein [Holtiella tumoricola]